MDVFDKYSELYDLLYLDKDYSKEVHYVLENIGNYGNRVTNILEYGSGTGKHGKIMAEKGYYIKGVELSDKMCAIAQKYIVSEGIQDKFEIVNANIVSYLDDKIYDCVLSLFHVMSYLTSTSDLIKVFQNAFSQLGTGGLFIFDVWYSPAVLYLRPQNKLKLFENEYLKILRFTEPFIRYNENIVDVNFKMIVVDKTTNQLTEIEETHAMRYFSLPEIRYHAENNGFELIVAEEFLTKREPSEKTWGVCFILRKR